MIRVAVVLTLIGLAVSLAHLLWPTPLLFALFMIAGQGAFGLAMVLYAVTILKDLRSKRVL